MTSHQVLTGDCIAWLRHMPSDSVHCAVTSPPYFGLRDYGTATWEGGDPNCSHRAPDEAGQTTKPSAGQREHAGRFSGPTCHLCGAKRIDSQIGLEQTPQAYVDKLVEVFREVRRVLRPDGTLWLNLGDSYAGSWGNQGRKESRGTQRQINTEMPQPVHDGRYPSTQSKTGSLERTPGLKPKDLIGIPWRVAFALQADGYFLRQDIIWAKPNPMPESVRDRCTKAHEYLFLLSKSEKYYFDADAIKEEAIGGASEGNGRRLAEQAIARTGNVISDGTQRSTLGTSAKGVRNKRSVWTIAPKPFKEAHFATFPPALVEPCVLAGTSEHGCCSNCGAPFHRVVAREFKPQGDVSRDKGVRGAYEQKPMDQSNTWQGFPRGTTNTTHLGWKQSCDCPSAPPSHAFILDPFAGAGTTGVVAKQLNRNFIGFELNPTYAEMANKRISNTPFPKPQP